MLYTRPTRLPNAAFSVIGHLRKKIHFDRKDSKGTCLQLISKSYRLLWDFPRQIDGEDPLGVFKALKWVDFALKLYHGQNLPKI